MEIAKKDIKDLRKGDKILLEATFETIYSGDFWARIEVEGNDWFPISIKPEKYCGIPVYPIEPIVKGSQFQSRRTGAIVEVHLARMGNYFCFFEIDPSKTIILNDQYIRTDNWERIK